MLRQFFFSAYQYYLYQQLEKNNDPQLAAIAVKSLKEVSYHLRWSSEWVIRLGDGTEESHLKMVKALDELWPYTQEFFIAADYEKEAGVYLAGLKNKWLEKISEILAEATLIIPTSNLSHTGGKQGIHGHDLDEILKDLQYMQRTYPGMEW